MTTPLERFRQNKDEYFVDGEHSPLDPEDMATFTGLNYFDENPDLAFELEIQPLGEGVEEIVQIEHSDGFVRPFRRAGTITFPVNGDKVTLTLLKESIRGRFFLPFIDGTSGDETYAAGRFLDPKQKPDGLLTVDFNYAYNPYCAYSDGWKCPYPPAENHLSVKIEAGEKGFERKG